MTWVFLIFLAGSADRVQVLFDLSYSAQLWAFRVLIWVGPLVALLVTHRVCVELQRGEEIERDRRAAEREAELPLTRRTEAGASPSP